MKNIFRLPRILIIIITVLSLVGCTNNIKKRISDKDSHKVLMKLKNEEGLEPIYNELTSEYRKILMYHEIGNKGDMAIIIQYGIRYEDITFEDLIDKIK
ncbi:hypothetical protein [Muriicola sp. Z0-33]|uniref:hypothetical protein n=1 Tax=Muriicola sp. Z0-33 TaxID=2816957 RepID=UPI002237DDE1|nr:hypothetical protein [Muriicola sp. Z0-33]MCW5516152.1 hypothetical protein [Muriicola sp. Z0-33]